MSRTTNRILLGIREFQEKHGRAPSQKELAYQINGNRSTVRRALDQLGDKVRKVYVIDDQDLHSVEARPLAQVAQSQEQRD